jgi:hypothetical protein
MLKAAPARMDSGMLRKIAEEEPSIASRSAGSYGSVTSRLRAAAAAAQPGALAMLQSVRSVGLLGSRASNMGQSLYPQAPSGSEALRMAIAQQQRLALEEQSRMHLIASAAIRQHQQLQEQAANKRSLEESMLASKLALDRVLKRRKVAEFPALSLKKMKKGDFIFPKPGQKDFTPAIKSLDSFRAQWDKFVAKAKSEGVQDEEGFVKYHFGKSLSQNRMVPQPQSEQTSSRKRPAQKVDTNKSSTEKPEENNAAQAVCVSVVVNAETLADKDNLQRFDSVKEDGEMKTMGDMNNSTFKAEV